MSNKFHNDGKRSRPFSDFGDSKLAVLLKSVRRDRDKGTPPSKEQITRLMGDLAITDDPVAAWRMWVDDCEPLLRRDV